MEEVGGGGRGCGFRAIPILTYAKTNTKPGCRKVDLYLPLAARCDTEVSPELSLECLVNAPQKYLGRRWAELRSASVDHQTRGSDVDPYRVVQSNLLGEQRAKKHKKNRGGLPLSLAGCAEMLC